MITIIVPIHNTEKYLDKCLDSISKQTYRNIEILCVDSSTDQSTNIIKKYANKDSRFKLIKNNNNSYGYKINLGIKKAKGNYIGIVDSDDYIKPEFYERAYESIKKYRLDFVKFDYIAFSNYPKKYRHVMHCSENKYFYNNVFNSKQKPSIFYDSNIGIWSGLYRKKFIVDNKIKLNNTAGAAFQDTSFFILTLLYAKRVKYIKGKYYNYRRDNLNSSSMSTKNVYSVVEEFDYILNVISNNIKISSDQRDAIICRKIFTYAWNYIRLRKDLSIKFERKIRKEIIDIINSDKYCDFPSRIKEYINKSGILNR